MPDRVIAPRRFARESAAKSDNGTSCAMDVKVLVVDDEQPFRAALRDLVAAMPGFTVVGEAASGEEAILEVEALRPELVLMDVRRAGRRRLAGDRDPPSTATPRSSSGW